MTQALPHGRHGLSRAVVVANQRKRMFAAVAELGYASTNVDRVASVAGLSRRTIYDFYPGGKPDVFLAALDDAAERLLGDVRAAVDRKGSRRTLARAGIRAVLNRAASDPTPVRLVVAEAMAADDQARAHREEFIGTLGELLVGDRSIRTTMWLGGVFELVQAHIRAGHHTELPGLLPDILASLRLASPATVTAGSR
jgi:AcrR family transcriptional regulator